MNLSGESENSSGAALFHLDQNISGKSEVDYMAEDVETTIFDNQYIRITLIFLYSVVFCFCFFGNLAVVLVVTLHWKMRSITKFCLGNLAFANLCVGIFCIYQNLSTFLIDRWLFGHFMCKMYHFINSLSHTASILILVVICVERYLAILHPFKSRQWITITRLRVAIVTVWILSAIVCSPRLYYISIIYFPVMDSVEGGRRYDMICAPQHSLYNAPLVDMSYFILLFILPLLVITVLYARIGIYVWKGSGISRNQIRSKGQLRSNSLKRNPTHVTDSSLSDSDSVQSQRTQTESYRMRRVSRGFSSRRRQAVRYSSSSDDAHSSGQRSGNDNVVRSTTEISELNSTEVSIFKPSLETPIETCCDNLNLKRKRRSFFGRKKINKSGNISGRKQSLKVKFMQENCKNVNDNRKPMAKTDIEEICSQDVMMNGGVECQDDIIHAVRSGSIESEGEGEATIPVAKTAKLREKKLFRGKPSVSKCGQANGSAKVRGKCVRPRQAVLRMLIVIVVTFAICNLPFHIRKICISYLPSYEIGSTFSNIFSPMTFLLMYTNCAINPIIYAFMSKGFRSSLVDLVKCRLKRNFEPKNHSKSSL